MLAVELSTGAVDSLNDQDSGRGQLCGNTSKRTCDVSLTHHLMTLPGWNAIDCCIHFDYPTILWSMQFASSLNDVFFVQYHERLIIARYLGAKLQLQT